jgi:hypothetical protein
MAELSQIYVLIDPVTSEPRYVGQTSRDAAFRAKEHWQQAKKNRDFTAWLASLPNPPEVCVLEVVPYAERFIAEARHTSLFRQAGSKLLNIATGSKPPPRSLEWRRRHAEAIRGRKSSPATREKMSRSQRERSADQSPELRAEINAKISASKKGHSVSAETRAKISASKKK